MIIPRHPSREYGLYVQEDNGEVFNLASPIWNWGKFYEQMIQLAFESNEELEARKGKKRLITGGECRRCDRRNLFRKPASRYAAPD